MMQRIKVERSGDVATIIMNDTKANVLNKAFFEQMLSVLAELEADSAVKAVILTGHSKFFSAGLDLKTLPALSKEELLPVLLQFSEMTLGLFAFPKPLIAAVNGHALAGGCVLMLCCDRRLLVSEGAKIGLNEVAIGLALPTFVSELALAVLGRAAVQEAVLEATIYDPQGALDIGYADRLVAAEALMEEASAVAIRLARLPNTAYGTTKLRLRQAALTRAKTAIGTEIEDFLRSGPFA
jgi:enoyl-CoA hydratase